MMRSFVPNFTLLLAAAGIASCQTYDFAFRADTDLQEVVLRFEVQTPSQADILFTVDNSISMTEEQAALIESFDAFIADLSLSDTAYRIGVTSTDAVGWSSQIEGDCDNQPFPSPLQNGFASKGNCDLPTNELFYPHDGARGRLLAAYDSTVYDINNASFDALSASDKAALARLFPTGPSTGPCEIDNSPGVVCDAMNPPFRVQCTSDGVADPDCLAQGAEYVIDRELVNQNACKACDCDAAECERGNACFDGCATNVAGAYVNAAFRSNIRGLGRAGQGWEQGIRSSLLSIGVEPSASTPEVALNPTNNLADPARSLNEAPNTFFTLDEVGNSFRSSWVRPDALFAVMFVTDEQDCSMAPSFFDGGKSCFEEGCSTNPGNNEPTGSVCYQESGQANLLSNEYMSRLLLSKKNEIASRVAVGLIGGLTRPDPLDRSVAEANDCVSNADGVFDPPDTECRCVTGLPDVRWCSYTENGDASSPTCDALGGNRYTSFAEDFARRTFESVCQPDFSEALIDFGDIAKLSCFDLNEISPADGDPSNIRVLRSPRDLAEVGVPPTELLPTTNGSDEEGWYFVAGVNNRSDQICLNRIDRLIGDAYEVRILSTDEVDPRRSPVEPVQ